MNMLQNYDMQYHIYHFSEENQLIFYEIIYKFQNPSTVSRTKPKGLKVKVHTKNLYSFFVSRKYNAVKMSLNVT